MVRKGVLTNPIVYVTFPCRHICTKLFYLGFFHLWMKITLKTFDFLSLYRNERAHRMHVHFQSVQLPRGDNFLYLE